MNRPAPSRADPLQDRRLTLAGLVHEVASGLEDRFRHGLAGSGLSAVWFDLLLRLARSPGHRLRMTDLAAQTALTPSGLTRAVDRLADEGLVQREACDTDRRGAWAVVTPRGLEALRAAVAVHLEDVQAHLIDPLTPAERDQLEATLRKLRDHVRPDAAQLTPEPSLTG